MKKTYQLADLSQIANWIIKNASSRTVLFYGAMGSGKTTLIKEISKQLGVQDVTSSPTFSLVNEYQSENDELVYHFDFYRINDEEEAYDIGIEEYFDNDAWCFVEWPEKVQNLLPLEASVIKLTINPDNTRTLELN
jgi:tRNA threonylcarbamoyladenosine biosynthesis protein TsaE